LENPSFLFFVYEPKYEQYGHVIADDGAGRPRHDDAKASEGHEFGGYIRAGLHLIPRPSENAETR